MKSSMATTFSDTKEEKATTTSEELPSYYLHATMKDGNGARPPMTTDAAGEFAGRYISINVILTSRDRMGSTHDNFAVGRKFAEESIQRVEEANI